MRQNQNGDTKHEPLTDVQKAQREELSWGHEGTQEKLPTCTNERRRKALNRSVNHIWNEYWRDHRPRKKSFKGVK